MKPKPRARTTRCRCGACADPSLPAMPQCAACRRVVRERRVKELSGTVPHTRLGSELAEAAS